MPKKSSEKKEAKNTKKKTKASKIKEEKKKREKISSKNNEESNYYESVGRRKKAIARVRLFTCGPSGSIKEGGLLINEKPYKEYFSILNLQKKIEEPFRKLKSLNRFRGTVKVYGGGLTGQAEATRHGIARALILFDENFRKKLKKAGYLTRDPRKKERKKFGKKKARKSPQWSKR